MQYIDRARRHIKLRDLHILLVVARRGSMAKAAVELANFPARSVEGDR